SSNLPDLPAHSLAIDPVTGFLFVGNDSGVFVSTDAGGTWSSFGTGLPNAQARELDLNSNTGVLSAGTHGRSMWQINLPGQRGGGGGGGGTGGFGPDRFEPNQTSDQATDLGTLSAGKTETFKDLTIATTPEGLPDYDWYRFSPAADGTFTATMTTRAGGPLE